MNTKREKDLENVFFKTFRDVQVPCLGFGTYELQGEECSRAVATALETGYRHVDTARMYENEEAVGRGIQDAGITRSDLFITSKVWWDALEPEKLKEEFSKSLDALDLEYLDLFLVHWPNPDVPLEETMGALKEIRESDQLRQFGVSNFPPSRLREAIKDGDIFCEQVEYHPYLGQDEVLEIAREKDLLLTAYSPLAQGNVMGENDLSEIAEKHGKSPAQIAIRWLLEQQQVAAIPRSSKPDHIRSNFDVFNFELEEEDFKVIADLPKDRRQVNPEFAPDWDS